MSDPDTWAWGASAAYQLPCAANSPGPDGRGTLGSSDAEVGEPMGDPPNSQGTMLEGSASEHAARPQPAGSATIVETGGGVDLAPFGRHPPVPNAPQDAQSAMPGVAAPYVPSLPAPGPTTVDVVASPRPEAAATSVPAKASTPNPGSGVGEASMSQPSFPSQPSAPDSPPGGEFGGSSSQSVYEFSGAADTGPSGPAATGPDPAETFGEAPSLNLDLSEEAPRNNLGSGKSTWVVVAVGVAVIGGIASYLMLRSPQEAAASEPDKAVAASDEKSAEAGPGEEASGDAKPEATDAPAAADAAPAPVDPKAAAAAKPDAKAEAPKPGDATPTAAPKAPESKPAAAKPAEPSPSPKKKASGSTSTSSKKKKKTSSGKKSIKSKKPPRDPFKGLPAPPG